MRILAIDPGNKESAYVVYNHNNMETPLDSFGKIPNEDMAKVVNDCAIDPFISHMAIEMVACYGMTVGKEVFDTCVWVGRYIEIWDSREWPNTYTRVYRKQKNREEGIESVCMEICKQNTAKDSNVRQAIIDRYPATGGGATPQIGTKGKPGPLYGVSKDVWAALAVAITYCDSIDRRDANGHL